jgi:hypothetical protein
MYSRRYKKKLFRKTHKKQIKTSNSLVAYGKIYATWCIHCKNMMNEWTILEQKMAPIHGHNFESANKDILIDEFNRKYKTDLRKDVGFPTIFKLTKIGGSVEYYKGPRNAISIMRWLRMKRSVAPGLMTYFLGK